MHWQPLARKLQRSKEMSDTHRPQEAAGSGLSSRDLLGIAAMCESVGVRHIGDTEDMEAKEDAFDEWMDGKWKAIRATELKRGDKMRDAAGGAINIDGVYPAGGDTVFVKSGSLSMHIPKNGVVLILPNSVLS